MQYKDLSEQQKAVSDRLESIFINSPALNEYDFVVSLLFLINKYWTKKVIKTDIHTLQAYTRLRTGRK